MANLTKRTIDAAQPTEKEYFIWCSSTPGFGIRIHPTGRKVFVAQVRVGRQTRRLGVGHYGPFTVDLARSAAQEIIRSARMGTDPQRERRAARKALSVAELCETYMEAARSGLVLTRFRIPKRPSTVTIDEGRITRHINPLIGPILARDLTRADVQRMVDQISKGKTKGVYKGKSRGKAVVKGGGDTAARAASLLGGIYTWAERRGLVAGLNPVRGVETLCRPPRDRVCSSAELRALGKIFEDLHVAMPAAIAALRLIALTGLRRQEACALKWSEIDEGGHCLRLSATKTGRSVRPVGIPVLTLLKTMPRPSSTWVFPNEADTGSADLKKLIASLFNMAGLHDARSHDLRRTFASAAADEGYSDATIAALLGHSQRNVTARHYIRRPDEALIAAADRTSKRVFSALTGSMANIIVLSHQA